MRYAVELVQVNKILAMMVLKNPLLVLTALVDALLLVMFKLAVMPVKMLKTAIH